MIKKSPFALLLIIPLLVGCVNLREVNQYAGTSINSLNRINEVSYSFNAYCQNKCELEQLRIGKIDTAFQCECENMAARADEAIQKMHFTIVAYLQAVHQLSDNKGFTYNVNGLAKSLQQNPLLGLNEQQAGMIDKAGSFIASAATAYYRQKKLNKYVSEADTVFQQLMSTFIFLVGNRLQNQLKIHYQTRMTNLEQMLFNAKGSKPIEQVVIKSTLDETAYYRKHRSLIQSYVELLKVVKDGHHTLYANRTSLNRDNAKRLLTNYVAEIQDLTATFKK
jgi:hypothetical protein